MTRDQLELRTKKELAHLARKKGVRETGPMRAFREWVASEMADTNKKYQAYKQQGLKVA